MPINSFLYPAPSTPSFVYNVANSLRFDSGSSDSLDRTISSSPTNPDKFTISVWVKRSKLSSEQAIIGQYSSSNFRAKIDFLADDRIEYIQKNDGNTSANIITTRKFRDISAWYHIVMQYDSTQSTSSNRIKFYVNGTQETSFDTTSYPAQNLDGKLNQASVPLDIGQDGNSSIYFSGYMAEFVLVDGQSLDPTSFGEFNSDSPTIWQPIDVSGLTFGDDGFYLDFENSSSLGADVSGQGNNFTVNNLTSVDQSTDTCTNNFATCNSLDNFSTGGTFSEGNLQTQSTTSNRGIFTGTIGLSSGVWYWEVKTSATGGNNASDQWNYIGIAGQVGAASTDNILGSSGTNSRKSHEYALQAVNGSLYNNGASAVTYGASFTEGDILGIKLDLDNNRLYFSKNGQWADGSGNFDESNPTGYISISDPSTTESGFYFPAWGDGGVNVNKTWQLNFGGTQSFTVSSGNQDPNGYGNFEYDTKSGYAICTKNLAEFG